MFEFALVTYVAALYFIVTLILNKLAFKRALKEQERQMEQLFGADDFDDHTDSAMKIAND